LGRFHNGRLEEFFEGFRTLTAPDLCDRERSQKIAVQLALSHRVIPVQPGEAPSLWKQLEEWLAGAKRASFAENSSEAAEYSTIDLASIEAHLEQLVAQVKPNFHVVFCHNDLLAANILEHPSSGELKLIDFEYGSANYLAFDIGIIKSSSTEIACATTFMERRSERRTDGQTVGEQAAVDSPSLSTVQMGEQAGD